MKDRASTYGSIGTAVLIFGVALMLGAGGSTLLGTFGVLAATAGFVALVAGTVLYFRAINRNRRT